MASPLLWVVSAAFVAVAPPAAGAECGLPNAVPPAGRSHVTLEGVSMPFGIGAFDWVSGRLMAYIADVLLSEVLGLNTIITGPWASSMEGTFALVGCTDPNAIGGPADRGCGPTFSTTHVTVESWDSTIHPQFLEELASVIGEAALPVDLGSVGYDGQEGLFVPTGPRLAALEASGLPLEYYRSYNRTWYNTSQYFRKYTDISTDGLLKCSESQFAVSAMIARFLEVTNDTEGTELVDGRLVAKCHGGLDGHWWFAPACRSNPETCIPVIDGGDGWSTDIFMQRSAAFNMPLALAVGTWEKYTSEPIVTDMLFYWWSPDTAFINLRPTPVVFPPNDKAEWALGHKTTESLKVPLKTRVHHAIPDIASRASELLGNIQLTMGQLEVMLFQTTANTSKPETEIACEWLKANPDIWASWVPRQTKCPTGWGLTSSTGEFVANRSLAAQCAWCPPGTYSEKIRDTIGPTAICVPCDKGKFQPSPGQSVCQSCEPGKFTGVEGMSVCEDCEAGTAVGESGMSACRACDPGYYAASRASRVCLACAPGTVARGSGAQECEACPIGTYAEGAGLTNCTTCGGGAHSWTTMRKLLVKGAEKWVSTDSAASSEACGCDVGARFDAAGACVECATEGIECPGMGQVVVKPGFYSPAELSVFKCGTSVNCKGGPPGDTCEEGREGISCASCKPGLMSGEGGACLPCDDGDKVPFALLVCAVLLACVVVYWAVDRGGASQPTHAVLLLGISGGLLVALMQQLSVVSMLDVQYMDPLSTFLRVVKVFTFDVEDYIHLSCLGKMPAVVHFTTKVCLIFATCLVVVIIHIVFVIVKYKRRFRERTPSLVAVFGTLAMVFYISVTVTILQPLQCNQNPNGMWTTQAYEDVICWEPSIDGDHQVMLAVGLVALIMPFALFAKVFKLVRQLPNALKAGDTRFMRSYGFLFFRFRPQAHWYIIVIMSRSLFIGIVPIIPRDIAQIYALQVALLVCFATCIYYQPWRVHYLNFMDAFFGGVMILFMNITAFCVKETNLEILGWVCVCMVLLALALLLVLFALALLRRCGKLTKPYRFFLCHCKAEAGAFARWLKLELASNPQVKQEVFLDSDNLESLDCLLGYVAADVATLVVIASKTIFFRPWCVGEMATAHGNAVHSIILEMPDYEPLKAEVIETYETVVPDLESLCVDNGISLQAVRQALTVFSLRERIGVPTIFTGPSMSALGKMLVAGTATGAVAAAPKAPAATPKVGIVRDGTVEANAIAFVLQRLMVRYTCFAEAGAPEVLCSDDDEDLPSTLRKALLLCTHGCFAEFTYLNRICEMADRGTQILPVIGDDEFRVPRPDIFLTIKAAELRPVATGEIRSAEMVARAVAVIFKEIAVPFKAKMDRYVALDSAAARAAKRLSDPVSRAMGSLASVTSDRRRSVEEKGESDDTELEEGFRSLEDAELILDDGDDDPDGLGLNIDGCPRPFEHQLNEFMVGFGRSNA